eukprot:TRINITY_DN106271_c0_g1_i1.p1 TRINITY_DN106271_c0_g1~~TRINITY_DN106271_c0_g1_i1.p1  ORF type:complete len:562 (+),score=100.88 TRINITY_DN106271_c0_g1_i1:39-1724(+)
MALVAVEDLREEFQDIVQRAMQAELESLKEFMKEIYSSSLEFPVAASKKEGSSRSNLERSDGWDQAAGVRPQAKLVPHHGALHDDSSASRDDSRLLSVRATEELHPKPPWASTRRTSARMRSELGGLARAQLYLLAITESPSFDWASAANVVLNSLWIGFQTDFVARTWSHHTPAYFHLVDLAFLVVSAVEVMMRALALGEEYFRGPGMKWQLFDVMVVSSQVVEFVVSRIVQGTSISGLRILKLVKILRIARVASVFPELHVLISSIVGSLQSLGWTLVLIVTFLYAIAVALTQLVNEHKLSLGAEHMEEHEEEIIEFYGSLDRSLISLYMIISEGIHWSELMSPLAEHVSPWIKPVFVIFVGFQLFAMMNVITSCFVDNALRIAAKAENDEALLSVFDMLQDDVGSGGLVNVDVFRRHFHHPRMAKFLELSGSQGEEPEAIFRVIDDEDSGHLKCHEFVDSCAKLVGPSRAFQVKQLMRSQCETFVQRLEEHKELQDRRLDEIQRHQNSIYAQQTAMLHEMETLKTGLLRPAAPATEQDRQQLRSPTTKKNRFSPENTK